MEHVTRNIFKFFRKQEVGFTLVEILVSMFIIVALTTILLANYHSTNRRAALITAAQKMASDMRLAQEYSLGSKEFNGQVPQGGWGVYFRVASNNEYRIFADTDGDWSFDGITEVFQIISLPEYVAIDAINISGGEATILFIPPDPTTKINNDDSIKSIKITLKESSGGTTKSVEVNFLGLVDVVD